MIIEAKDIIYGAEKINIKLTLEQGKEIALFTNLLWEENKKFNLISIENPKELLHKHILDSLAPFAKDEFLRGKTVIDLGSGGGFPGIPLGVLALHKSLYLLESNKKKCRFLERVVDILSLENVFVIPVRAEEAARNEYREKFDIVVSRAVAPLPSLVELALPLLRRSGFLWAYKGPGVKEEIELSKRAIQLCGGKVSSLKELHFPHEFGINKRYLLQIYKEYETPEKYPRKPGKAQKYPLS